MNIPELFKNRRHDPAFHLGLGDIRLTLSDQEEIEAAFDTRATDRDAELAAMRETLEGISRADYRQWDEGYNTPKEFVSWAKSRANHALASTAGTELLERLRLAVDALRYVHPILRVLSQTGEIPKTGETIGNWEHIVEAEKEVSAAISKPPTHSGSIPERSIDGPRMVSVTAHGEREASRAGSTPAGGSYLSELKQQLAAVTAELAEAQSTILRVKSEKGQIVEDCRNLQETARHAESVSAGLRKERDSAPDPEHMSATYNHRKSASVCTNCARAFAGDHTLCMRCRFIKRGITMPEIQPRSIHRSLFLGLHEWMCQQGKNPEPDYSI